MKIKSKKYVLLLIAIALYACHSKVENPEMVNRQPQIYPDYTGLVIPPNIAPLNFKISEPGSEFEVRISTINSEPIIIHSNDSNIKIDIKQWHKLLANGKGRDLKTDVFVRKSDGKWIGFKTIVNYISQDSIDSHLAYRLINTGYVIWSKMGIYQRNIENFDQKTILENSSFDHGSCLNCHSFSNNNPNSMMLHVRAKNGGTIINSNGKLIKIDTKTNSTISAGVYPCWHPNGKHIAFSVNTINQHFLNGAVRIEVSDEFSDIVIYDIEKNEITTTPELTTKNRENLPVWSPDGKYLYLISAPKTTNLQDRIYAKYDLLRISYDVNTKKWGTLDTVLSSAKTGLSISFPKISPDGKFIMFCMSPNGYFTIHHPATDLYLLNLSTGIYKKMDINSPQTDSYHCFSSTGRWVVFSSKRMDGLFTRPFFCHFDTNGNTSKPFVLPQKDPEFYDTFLKNYNIPELITGEVNISSAKLRDKVLEKAIPAKLDTTIEYMYSKTD